MQQDTRPPPVAPSPSTEDDIAAVVQAMRVLGQPHARRLRDLLEAKVETRAERQSAR